MNIKLDTTIEFARVLRAAGFKATRGRLALLEQLAKSAKPMTVTDLAHQIRKHLDQANTYRALQAFDKKGLVRRIDFGHDHAHYELAESRHHHHVVCDSCGKVADVEVKEQELEKLALHAAREFKSIRTHALEFFGLCRACTT